MSTDSTSLEEVLDAADTAFAVTDQRCRIRWLNRYMAELLELTIEQSLGRSLTALLAGAPDGPHDGVVISQRLGVDRHCWLEVRCSPLEDGQLLYRVIDVSRWREHSVDPAERDEWQKALIRMADEDPLTGLLNRRALTRELERQLALGHRGTLLLLDLDNFKDINDLRGHPAGDRVMCTLANVLRERLGEGHVLGRLGGDEFAVVLADTDETTAVAIADRLRNAVAAIPVTGGGGTTRTTVSAGVAGFESGESWQAVLANADLALYASKDAGRNRVTVYEQGHYADTALRVTVLDRVRAALAGGGLALHAMQIGRAHV